GTYPNSSRSAGYGVAVGAGRPEAAVAAIAKTAEWAAAGLARSGLGEWYACFIGTLDGVSRALSSAAPDRASQQLALQMYAPYLSEVAHRIPSFDPHRGGCGYRGQQRRGPNRNPRDDWDWNGANAPWSSDQERWDSYDDELDGPNNGWPFPIR
ncbi:MAG TPA: hypothetical protein VM598_01800, partial [Bdellovibrionota bacterium]|nr:hypothetical protein [Bdellovibrionota bacterium]